LGVGSTEGAADPYHNVVAAGFLAVPVGVLTGLVA